MWSWAKSLRVMSAGKFYFLSLDLGGPDRAPPGALSTHGSSSTNGGHRPSPPDFRRLNSCFVFTRMVFPCRFPKQLFICFGHLLPCSVPSPITTINITISVLFLCSSGRNFNVFVEASLQGLKFYNDLLRSPGKQSFANEWCTLRIVVGITKHAISICNYVN